MGFWKNMLNYWRRPFIMRQNYGCGATDGGS